MPPKKAKKADKGDKAKDNTPTVRTRAMARKEKDDTAAAASAAGGAPAKGGRKAATKPAAKTAVKPAAKPAKGVKRKREADEDEDGDGDDDDEHRADHLRGLCDDRLDDIEEAIRAVGREVYKDILLPEHKSTETRREKRANNKIPADEEVELLTKKKRKSKNFPDGFVYVSFEELGEMAKVLENLLAAQLEKRRIQYPKAKGLDSKKTRTSAEQWNKHGLTLRELLDLHNHKGPAVQEPTRYVLKRKCKQYGLNPVGGTLWDLDRAILLYELAGKQRLYDLPQDLMEKIMSALESVEAPEEAANGKEGDEGKASKKLDEEQRRSKDNYTMNEDVVTVTSNGQSQRFAQVNVSGHGLRCMWHAVQEIWLDQQKAPGTTVEERYPVNARVCDLWDAVMHQPDGSTNPARLSRRALYRAIQQDSQNNVLDGTLEERIYNLEMGDLDMLQLVADALDVEIFTYTPQHESDGTTTWSRSARGQPQTDPQRQIHLANYMHAIHWTALRPSGPFALPALNPVARVPNFGVLPPGPLPRLPIGHFDNVDIRPEVRHDDPEDGHVADMRDRDLEDDEYELESGEEEEEEEEEEEADEDEDKNEEEDEDSNEYSDHDGHSDGNGGVGRPSAGGNGGGVPTIAVSRSPSYKSSLRNGGRPSLSPRSPIRRIRPHAERQMGGSSRTRPSDPRPRSISNLRSISSSHSSPSPRREIRSRNVRPRRSLPASPQRRHQNPTMQRFWTPSTPRSSQPFAQTPSSSSSDSNFAARLLSAPPMFSPRGSSSRSSQSSQASFSSLPLSSFERGLGSDSPLPSQRTSSSRSSQLSQAP